MSNNDSQQIVNKAWNFAHVLRDDGLSYMAYTEQITFLLFLKMAHEQTKPQDPKDELATPVLEKIPQNQLEFGNSITKHHTWWPSVECDRPSRITLIEEVA
jgi:type I restriction-modification system DNA methylase subunit